MFAHKIVNNMKNFNKFFAVESVLDPEQPTLNKNLFDLSDENSISLKPEVRTQILAGIAKLSKHFDVLDYTVIGSSLTKKYTETSDIDVNLFINNKTLPMSDARKLAIKSSGEFVHGTKNPIEYHVLNSKTDFNNANESADAVFDLSSNKFIRMSKELPFHVEKYMSMFKKRVEQIKDLKNDLADELLDYSELKKFSHEDATTLKLEIEKELKSIEDSAVGLVDLHKKILKDRAKAFAKDLTANDIKEYGSKNLLPGNVVYKLLERHYYIQFLQKVEDVMADGKVTSKEADKLNQIIKSAPN